MSGKRRIVSVSVGGKEAAIAAAARKNREALDALKAQRAEAGVCRHCGGPVPCWSPFGDASPGVKNS